MDVEILPEPTPEERRAILAALADEPAREETDSDAAGDEGAVDGDP